MHLLLSYLDSHTICETFTHKAGSEIRPGNPGEGNAYGWRLPHTEKTFWNLVNSNQNQIVFTIFRLIWIQTDVSLDPIQSENGKYNLILV